MWGYGYGPGMMGSWGYGGYGFTHMIVWLLVLIAVIAGLVWLFRTMTPAGTHHVPAQRPAGLEVLEERYARGEIGRDEYLQKKHDILD